MIHPAMGKCSSVRSCLEGKVALITGGASGIGKATAKAFSQNGAKVVIADIQDELAHEVCKEISPTTTSASASASFVHCDVTTESDVQNAVDTTVAKHGKLDIMFNSAGAMSSLEPHILDNENVGRVVGHNILNSKQQKFEQILWNNLTGPLLGTKHAARVMIPAGGGTIINTAFVRQSYRGVAPYWLVAPNHAVLALTKNAEADLGWSGVRVNCVLPYLIKPPFAGQVRLRDNDDNNEFVDIKYSKVEVYKQQYVAHSVLALAINDCPKAQGIWYVPGICSGHWSDTNIWDICSSISYLGQIPI